MPEQLPDQPKSEFGLPLFLSARINPYMFIEPIIKRVVVALHGVENARRKAVRDVPFGNITIDVIEHVEDLEARLNLEPFTNVELLE